MESMLVVHVSVPSTPQVHKIGYDNADDEAIYENRVK